MKNVLLITAVLAAAVWAHADIQPIIGTNVVGYTTPATLSTNTLLTVPFEACMGNGSGCMLADLVATNGLISHASDPVQADQLVVLTTNNNAFTYLYYYYYYKTGTGWTGITTTKLMPDGLSTNVTPPVATAFPIKRGLAFWLKRPLGSSTTSVYLKGQVSPEKQATAVSYGLNLVGYGAVTNFALNGVNWTGAYGGNGNTAKSDKILVCNGNGTFNEYFYFVKPSAWSNSVYDVYTPLSHKWITKDYGVADVTIHAGEGFWYLRRGAVTFTFRPDGN